MYVYVDLCICICMPVYMYACMHLCMQSCVRICLCVTYVYVCGCVHGFGFTCVHVYMCRHVCMCTCLPMCIWVWGVGPHIVSTCVNVCIYGVWSYEGHACKDCSHIVTHLTPWCVSQRVPWKPICSVWWFLVIMGWLYERMCGHILQLLQHRLRETIAELTSNARVSKSSVMQ